MMSKFAEGQRAGIMDETQNINFDCEFLFEENPVFTYLFFWSIQFSSSEHEI